MNILQEYSKTVMDHFMHPRNIGELKDADGIGEVGNPRCGDVMKLYIKVSKRKKGANEEEYINDVKVQTLGCGAAIAAASMASEMIRGESIDRALKLSNKEVADALGGVPQQKIHCSILAKEAVKKAIEDYNNKK